ncbi:MAG: hypothetical protein FWE76_09110 [Symbiobacteriaceae bacterium]|nr:hypothetical protein [Symbiobacteriaceae bacterium]
MLYQRMMSLDIRIIYLITTIAIMFPMFIPLGLPVAPDPPAVELYRVISELPAGTPIIYSFDLGASGTTELKPASIVMLDLSLEKKHRLILMGWSAEGPNLMNAWCGYLFDKHGAVYGEDYINIGFVASAYSWLELSRIDIRNSWNNIDYLGKPLDQFPIMDGIYKASDITAVCSIGTGDPGYTHWMQQWYATGECDIILAAQPGVNVPIALTMYNSGLIKGLSGGLVGAATLELCHGVKGSAHGNSDAQSFGHLTIIVFLIIGNIGYLGAKRAGEVK